MNKIFMGNIRELGSGIMSEEPSEQVDEPNKTPNRLMIWV